MLKNKRTINIEGQNLYNRNSYTVGTRISRAQVAHRVGYFDKKTKFLYNDQWLDYDAWIWIVNQVRERLDLSPKDAARYVNGIYQTKLGTEGNKFSYLAQYILILRNTCGKWFSVVPSMMVV